MINNGMPGASLAIADPGVRAGSSFSLAGAGIKLVTATGVVLLIPAMLVVGLVAILVPCFLSVPVCGPTVRPPGTTSRS
jgi:hypothetical protein